MATTTNFGWETPDDTDLVKDGAAAIRTSLNGVDSSFADLKGGTTGQVLSKASGTDLDFTWVAQDDSNAIQNAIVDAKGDLIAATAADTPARLAVGTNGQVLTADSTASTGLAWSTPSSGGLTLIQETTASALSSLSFSSISGSYKQLLLVWSGVRHSATGSQFAIRFNNNSGSVYFLNGFQGQGSNFNVNGTSQTHLGGIGTDAIYGFGESSNEPSGFQTDCNGQLLIDNYASSTKIKNVKWNTGYFDNSAGRYNSVNSTSIFNSTTAVTSIDIVRLTGSATFTNQNNSSIRLYGVS